MRGKIKKITPISEKFHNIFRFTKRIAEVTLGDGTTHSLERHVLETGPAVSVLPYLYDKDEKQWHVVLVRQYRPAVDEMSLEAPGGLLEKGRNVREEMARELQEEAGIGINPLKIELIGEHHLASSFCDQVVHLGTIKLEIESIEVFLKNIKRHNGVVSEKEFTEVMILPLSKALKEKELVKYTLAKYQIYELAHRLNYEA
jgi:8-oxo-dGTP pyrophosphatase MutT (NUDIX family)